jgi:hypothetical protein
MFPLSQGVIRMTHEEIKDCLDSFDSGELSAPERGIVQSHLSVCAECRYELTLWTQLKGCRRPPDGGQSERVVCRVMNTLRAREVHRRRLSTWGMVVVASGGIALFLFLHLPREAVRLDELLLSSETGNSRVSWLLQPEKPKMDDLAEIVWEGV